MKGAAPNRTCCHQIREYSKSRATESDRFSDAAALLAAGVSKAGAPRTVFPQWGHLRKWTEGLRSYSQFQIPFPLMFRDDRADRGMVKQLSNTTKRAITLLG
jgi:hypothetical protein